MRTYRKPERYSGPNGDATIVDGGKGEHGEPHWSVVHRIDGEVYTIPKFTDFHCARSVAMGLVSMTDEPDWDEQAQDWCEDQASRR